MEFKLGLLCMRRVPICSLRLPPVRLTTILTFFMTEMRLALIPISGRFIFLPEFKSTGSSIDPVCHGHKWTLPLFDPQAVPTRRRSWPHGNATHELLHSDGNLWWTFPSPFIPHRLPLQTPPFERSLRRNLEGVFRAVSFDDPVGAVSWLPPATWSIPTEETKKQMNERGRSSLE